LAVKIDTFVDIFCGICHSLNANIATISTNRGKPVCIKLILCSKLMINAEYLCIRDKLQHVYYHLSGETAEVGNLISRHRFWTTFATT
jgi:predicted DsbA family dithiol-disulfide isomerase